MNLIMRIMRSPYLKPRIRYHHGLDIIKEGISGCHLFKVIWSLGDLIPEVSYEDQVKCGCALEALGQFPCCLVSRMDL